MARYEHLPIYKKAMDMAIYFEKVVRNFSRYHKYAIGTDLRRLSKEVVALIIKANSSVDKLGILTQLRDKIEELKIAVRICKEAKAFNNFNTFKYAMEEIISIGRQNEGWIKSIKGRDR